METDHCDCCGLALVDPKVTRYEVRITIEAVHDPNMTRDEPIAGDLRSQIQQLLKQMEAIPEVELRDEVHREFRFLLCRACQRDYVENPMPSKPS